MRYLLAVTLLLFFTVLGQISVAAPARIPVGEQTDVATCNNPMGDNHLVTVPWWHPKAWSQERRLTLLGLTSLGAVAAIGLSEWDYGTASFRFRDEGWFGSGTYRGGADKLGHAWSGYALTSLYRAIYRSWGSGDDEALFRGAMSSAAVMTLLEVGDGFSKQYGFSWEDEVMDVVGVGMAYLRHTCPELEKRVGFRVEFRPWEAGDSSKRYLLAFKLGGILVTDNPVWRAVDLQIGYFTCGYTSDRELKSRGRHRYGYVGLGLNVTYLLQRFAGTSAAGIFDYVQIPGTSLTTR